MSVSGAPGEVNGINVDKSGAFFTVTDTSAPVAAGTGCTLQATFKRVRCSDAGITRVRVAAGDLDDTVNILYSTTTPTTISGGSGDDTLSGGPGNDIISADAGGTGFFGTESLNGGDGRDTLIGSSSTNTTTSANGGDGNDSLQGGPSNDSMTGGPGADDIHGGGGTFDTTNYFDKSTPVTVTIDDIANDGEAGENDNVHTDVENVTGGSSADTLTGSSGPDQLSGGPGADTLNGLSGDDSLNGDNDGDTLNGGAGDDFLVGGFDTAADVYNGGTGTDTANFGDHSTPVTVTLNNAADDGAPGEADNVKNDVENILGGTGNDTLNGNGRDNVLQGSNGNDTLRGLGGNDRLLGDFQGTFGSPPNDDTLIGGSGDDSMLGGPGADVFSGSPGSDTADYSSASTPQTISIDNVANDGSAGENDNVRTDVEAVVGGSADDMITGSSGDNVLFGSPGNDRLAGGAGNDLLDGETPGICCTNGNDTFNGGPGNDGVSYRSHFNPVTVTIDGVANDGQSGETDNVGANVENLLGGSGFDTLSGSASGNIIAGGGGFDTINGLDGNDLLAGEGGSDIANGGNGNDQINSRSDFTTDTDNCGADTDSVVADTFDTINADCENAATTSPVAHSATGPTLESRYRSSESRLAVVAAAVKADRQARAELRSLAKAR